MMRGRRGKILLLLAGLATASGTYWAARAQSPAAGRQPAPMHPPHAPMQAKRVAQAVAVGRPVDQAAAGLPVARVALSQLSRLRQPLSPETAHDPFATSSWLPPPPPSPPPPPPPPPPSPPPPVAPPLPFKFVGVLDVESAKPKVFLDSGDRLLIVSPGEVIDGRYRLESLAATRVVFTYLPLNQQQTLNIETEGK